MDMSKMLSCYWEKYMEYTDIAKEMVSLAESKNYKVFVLKVPSYVYELAINCGVERIDQILYDQSEDDTWGMLGIKMIEKDGDIIVDAQYELQYFPDIKKITVLGSGVQSRAVKQLKEMFE